MTNQSRWTSCGLAEKVFIFLKNLAVAIAKRRRKIEL
jgi:hypothetical protein